MMLRTACSHRTTMLKKQRKTWASMKKRKKRILNKIRICRTKLLFLMCREFKEEMSLGIQLQKKWSLSKKMKKKKTRRANICLRINWITWTLPFKILFTQFNHCKLLFLKFRSLLNQGMKMKKNIMMNIFTRKKRKKKMKANQVQWRIHLYQRQRLSQSNNYPLKNRCLSLKSLRRKA